MKPERWQRLQRIFLEAVELPKERQGQFLDAACAADRELRCELERMLRSEADESSILDRPPFFAAGQDESGAELEEARDGLLNERVGPYRITDRVAAGGMGVVYRAIRADGLFDHEVAVKIVRRGADTEQVLERFRAERRTLANLNHPNISRLIDGGAAPDGRPYLVMEYIDGLPIDDYCDQHKLTIRQRLQLFTIVAHAVHHAHQNLVVHRDLKPSNIMVNRDGEVKLLDFGIAKMLSGDDGETPGAADRTATIARVLTPDYASPEQIRGENVTTASDVYSLGVVLYSLLTGRRPYRLTSASYRAIERTICEQDPRRPSTAAVAAEDADPAGTPQPMQSLQEVARARGTTPEKLRRQIRGDLDNIVMMALRKEPSRRYASAEQMAEDIERCLAGLPVLARKDTFWYRGSKFVRRNKIGVASAALLVLALAGGVLGTSRMAHLANQEAQHARIEALSGYEITNFLIEALMVAAPMRSQEQIGEVIALLDAHEEQIHRQYEHQPHLRANLHDAIGRVFLRLRRFERAEDVFTEAAEIRQTHFGDESLEMSLSLSNLGELAYMRGDFAAAESHLREALRLHRALPPGVHTDVAEAANNLAAALRSLGRLEEAEQLHREALTLRRQRLGPKDPLVAESLNNLAGVHLARGDYDLALDGLRESLRIREQILGRNHPLTAESLNNLAVTLHHLARLDEAAAAYRESIERMREVPAVDRTHLARSATNLADIERRNGNLAQARNLLDEALEIQQQQSGEEPHPSLATTLASLAQLEHELDNPAAAEDHWREALRIRRAAFPRPHATIATTLVGYGSFLVDRQRPAEALPLLRQGCNEYEAALPAEHWLRAYAQVALGVCLTQLRQFEAAERILLEALPLLEASRGTDSEEATRARAALRELYELWEKPRQAERFTSDGDYE